MAKGIVSSNPQAMVAGGLINDVDIVITNAEWCHYDYGGTTEPRFMAAIYMAVLVDGQPGDEHCQYYAAGSAQDWGPDPDDNGRTPIKLNPSKSAFTSGSNWAMFTQSLVEAGFPANKLDDSDLGNLIGLKAHVLRKAVKREGLSNTNAKGKENTVLVITHLLGAGRGAAARPAATRTQAPAAATNAPAATTQAPAPSADPASFSVGETILSLLSAAPNSTLSAVMLRAKYTGAVNSAVKSPAERKPLIDEFARIMDSDEELAGLGLVMDRTTASKNVSIAG